MTRPPNWVIGLIVPVGLGILWEAAVNAGLTPGRLMPPPGPTPAMP